MISFHRYLPTSQAFSVQVENVSIHLEKVQTNTSKHLHPLAHGISVKSTLRFLTGVPPTFATRVAFLALVGDYYYWHMDCTSHICRKLGDIKCWAKVVSRAVHPE
jgi:hypothetical protein